MNLSIPCVGGVCNIRGSIMWLLFASQHSITFIYLCMYLFFFIICSFFSTQYSFYTSKSYLFFFFFPLFIMGFSSRSLFIQLFFNFFVYFLFIFLLNIHYKPRSTTSFISFFRFLISQKATQGQNK